MAHAVTISRRVAMSRTSCVTPVYACGLSEEKTKQVFLTVALFAHGYASIIANNHL